jgi:hypothetical protein
LFGGNTIGTILLQVGTFFSKPDFEILAGAKNGRKISAREIKMVDVH